MIAVKCTFDPSRGRLAGKPTLTHGRFQPRQPFEGQHAAGEAADSARWRARLPLAEAVHLVACVFSGRSAGPRPERRDV